MTGIVSLMLAEREHHSLWWSALNEMLLNRELPDWVMRLGVGGSADFERYDAAKSATNMILFGTTQVLPDDFPSVLIGDRQEQIDVIEAERTFGIRWWTMLNEMRAKRQLPDWVTKMSLGHGPDIEQWREKAGAVNLQLFGVDYVRGSATIVQAQAHRLREMLT